MLSAPGLCISDFCVVVNSYSGGYYQIKPINWFAQQSSGMVCIRLGVSSWKS